MISEYFFCVSMAMGVSKSQSNVIMLYINSCYHQDLPLFEGIYRDLFPGVELPQPDRDELINVLKVKLTARNLLPSEWYLGKIIQVYEMILVRHGLMIVGEPMGGKTCAYQVSLTDFRYIIISNYLIYLSKTLRLYELLQEQKIQK